MIGLLDRLRRRPVLPRQIPQRGVFAHAPDDDGRPLRFLLLRQIKRPAGQILQRLPGKCLHLKDRVIAQLDRAAASRSIALRLEHAHGLAEAVLAQRRMAADLCAERLGLHRAVCVGIHDVCAQRDMDGDAVVRPFERLRVRIDPAVEHGGRLRRERGADRLAQRLRVEPHRALLRFPLRLELALCRIGILAERQRLRLHDHALREQPRAEQQLLRLLRRHRLQLHPGYEQRGFERLVLIVLALHLAVLRKWHGKAQRPQRVFIVQIGDLQIRASL